MTGFFLYNRLNKGSMLVNVDRSCSLNLILDMMTRSDMFFYNSWLDVGCFMVYRRGSRGVARLGGSVQLYSRSVDGLVGNGTTSVQ